MITSTELITAVVEYLAVVVENDAVQEVAESNGAQEPIGGNAVGWSICELYEHKHGPLTVDRADDVAALINLGLSVEALCKKAMEISR
jgi:hypothetical protein